MMVESEAYELSEAEMLGAVKFGHEQMQPVIDLIIDMAEDVREGALRLHPGRHRRPLRQRQGDRRRGDARGLRRPQQARAPGRGRRGEGRRSSPASPRRSMPTPASTAVIKKLESDVVRGDILDARPPHRRPRPRHRPPDRGRGRRAAAHPRLVALHPRRDPGAGGDHARHRRRRADASTRCTAPRSNFLLHYNFPPYSVGETGRMGGPGRREIGHGKLAWRALQAVLPAATDFPYTIRVVSEITEFERLLLDGDGLRLVALDDGRRRAAEGAGRRRRDGPDPRGREVRGADRHPRRRGPSRRHGLQGRRHRATASPRCRWTSRSRGITPDDHGAGPRPGEGRPDAHPRRDGARR